MVSDEPGGDSEPVPKLPRGRGIRLTGPEVFRILMTVGMLIAVLVLAKPCGNAVSSFVMGFEGKNKGSAMPKPGNVDIPQLPGSAGDYVELHPGMTDDEVRAAIAAAKAKAHERAGSAASTGSATGSGSAATATGSAASSMP